jgi:hypothetical protein
MIKKYKSYSYTDLQWTDNGFGSFSLVKIDTIGDGNCLFHALANGFYKPYIESTFKNIKYSKRFLIKSLRQELSELLDDKVPGTNKTYYQTINNGMMESFSENVPSFKLENMKIELNSNSPLGYGYMEYISMILDKDIYILEGKRQDIYNTDELKLMATGNRNSIIIHYDGYHYDLIGIENNDEISTYFLPSHKFIKFLQEKVNNITELPNKILE